MNQKKYDVAVIGLAIGANYGSVLTYYSLYKAIEALGKKVLMVSKIGASADDPELNNTHATRFAHENYDLSQVYSTKTVSQLNEIVDTFVIGSDQVWNYGVSRNFGKAFYLDFADDSKRKISYAASFGHAKDFAPDDEVPKISSLMKRFNCISVREDSGVKIARDVYGVPAKQVVDPIFLTTAKDYAELASRSERDVSGPYLLAYILDPSPEKKAAIVHIAGSLGLNVRIVLDGFPHLFDENKSKMNFETAIETNIDAYGFLKLFSESSYVITDSFHGTAFALRFSKPFAAIGNKRRGMTRFDTLLRLADCRSRFTLDASDIVSDDARFLAEMKYDQINSRLNKSVSESKLWLKQALEKPVESTVASSLSKYELVESKLISKLRRPAKFLLRNLRGLKRILTNKSFNLSRPNFVTANGTWRVTNSADQTKVKLLSPDMSVRGNLTWCDLPTELQGGEAYELKLDWSLQTTSPTVNLHLRNSSSGIFKVVGTVTTGSKLGVARTDAISFIVPPGKYSQLMFGAVHFTGPDAGFDMSRIVLRSVSPESVVPNKPSLPSSSAGKAPAEVVREMTRQDADRFINFYAQRRVSRGIENSRALLMFYSHGLEKGLSRNSGFRPGFGEATMGPFSDELNSWLAKGRKADDTFFQISVSVLRVYFDKHQALGVDVSHFWRLFSAAVQEEIRKASLQLGGAWNANTIREVVPTAAVDHKFLDVVFGRRSIREFTAAAVDDRDIQMAVQVALQAPSVCNRQSARVHQFDDPVLMQSALDLQGGFRGYKMPPKLLLVTSDLSSFVGAVERNQPFIDGGLFMMGLLLGLQNMGLGTCCLNTAMSTERASAIRKILGIPESEVFISFIAVGHYIPDSLTPRSKRIAVEDVLIRHN